MFFMLCCEKEKRSFTEKVKGLFKSDEPTVEKITPYGCLPFYKLTVKEKNGKPPIGKIENAVGKLCSRAVVSNEIRLPKSSKIKRFVPKVFPQRVLFNSAAAVLNRLSLDPASVYVTVFDENGYLLDLVEKLIPLSCMIRVVTQCTDAYEKKAAQLIKKYGVSLVILPSYEKSILESTVIISDKSSFLPSAYKGILFTNEKCRTLGEVVWSDKIGMPESLLRLCADGIDELTFAGALYELCSCKELEDVQYIYK